MRRNGLKQTLEAGNLALGVAHISGAPATIEAMAAYGIDWVTIDTEHVCNDVGRIQELITVADAAGITPVVRVPEVNRMMIQQVLDAGAGGVMISHVASREQAIAAVQAAKFPPIGRRGASPMIRAAQYGYGAQDWSAFAAESNREVLVVVLIEEKEGYERIDEILSVPGVDIVFLGNFDLSINFGLPGETRWDHPVLSAALDRVIAVAKKHEVYVQISLGTNQEDPEYTSMVAQRGVDLLGCSSDMHLVNYGLRRIASLRPALSAARRPKKA